MLYTALAALLLVQVSGEPVAQVSRKLAEDQSIMRQGRDILVTECGGLGMEQCGEGDDGTCLDDLVPVNLGGLSTICRTPEEAAAQLGQDAAATPTDVTADVAVTTVTPTPVPEEEDADSPAANCGGLGMEQCPGGVCDDDLVPVNLGGLSTICRTPEEAAAQLGQGDAASPTTPDLAMVDSMDTAELDANQRLAAAPAGDADAPCGAEGQPVCAGAQLDDREFECDYGFMGGDDDTCVPYVPVDQNLPPPVAMAPGDVDPAPVPVDDPQPAPTPVMIDDGEFEGELTFYGGAGAGGACTSNYVPEGFTTVALNNPQYTAANECGSCVEACYNDGSEQCFMAIVDNLCPECAFGDLDLGESGDGRWPLTWNWIECPTAPGGTTFTLQGSNASYAKVKAEGGPASMTGMTCNGIVGTPTPDSFFEFNDTENQNLDDGMECTVTFSNGESITQTGV